MNERRLAGMSILLAVQLLYIGQGRADSWQSAVSARVSTEFDTNPAMSPTNPGSAWRALFEPSYSLLGKIGENELRAGLALQVSRSSNKVLSPDRDSPSVFFNWLRPSDAGEFGISSRYAEMATRDSGGIDATGRVPVASTRSSRTLSGSWNKELSERSTLLADSAYEGVSYKGGTYTDYSMRSGGLRINYGLSEQITSFGRVSGNKYVPASGGPSSSLTDTTLGMNWKDEYVDWTMQVGEAKFGGNAVKEGSVEAHYTGQRTQLTLNAGRSVYPSGLGGFIKADRAMGGWSYALSEYSNIGIDLQRQKNLSTTIGSNAVGASSGIWIERSLTPSWKMKTYYLHRTNQGGGVDSASSNLFGLSFSYDNSDF